MRFPFPDGDVLIDDEDIPLLRGYEVYIGTGGYPCVSTGAQLVHLIVMGGPFPGKHVDHKDWNLRDCRKSNLRVVTYQINQVNRKALNKNNTSGARGVVFRRSTGRWLAQITVDKRNIFLGSFSDVVAAVTARQAAELQHYGELCPR